MKSLQFFITVQIMIIILSLRTSKWVWWAIECLGENTEKHKAFTGLIEKEVTNIDKDGNEVVVTISK